MHQFTAVSTTTAPGRLVPITLTATGLTIERGILFADRRLGRRWECDCENRRDGRESETSPQSSGNYLRTYKRMPGRIGQLYGTIRHGHPLRLVPSPAIGGITTNDGSNSITVDFYSAELPSCALPLRMPVKPAQLSAKRSYPPPSLHSSK
ncbi:MAG: hypothetical protein IPG32_01145 [Saprospirales bacterium]|nr:hypothetical protein [Saprospirales bacterium]